MTPRERADDCIRKFDAPMWPQDADTIEAAITAAIEEEREACAQIADEYRKAVDPGAYGAAYKTVMAGGIRDAIRARSEK